MTKNTTSAQPSAGEQLCLDMPFLNVEPYYQDGLTTIYHIDSRLILPHLPDFDLLLTDPPYGLGAASKKFHGNYGRANRFTKGRVYQRDYGDKSWDDTRVAPWALEVARLKCRKQIIWGGNYFGELPACKGPLIWDKENGSFSFADGELAWNNLGKALRIKRHLWSGCIRKGGEARLHPTQKPLDVMAWCLQLAGKDVETILDPWIGSGTVLRAAKDAGKQAVGIDFDEEYCEIAAKRLAEDRQSEKLAA